MSPAPTGAARRLLLLRHASAQPPPPGGRDFDRALTLAGRETAARIGAFMARHGLRPDPFTPEELASVPEALTPEGWLRTHPALWPDRGGMDGFFAARFVRA